MARAPPLGLVASASARLQRQLGPLPPAVLRAFDQVPAGAFLPAHLTCLAGADAPLPFFEHEGAIAVTPSPRVLALLLAALEPHPGMRVLLVGPESGYLAALCLEAGAKEVRLVGPDREVAAAAQGYVAAAGLDRRIAVVAGPPLRVAGDGPWDRILLLDPRRTLGTGLGHKLPELGFALALAHTAEGFEVVKTLKSGPDLVPLRAPDLALGGEGLPEGPGSFLSPAQRRSLSGLMALEEMAHNVWRGDAPTEVEVRVWEGVEATWRLAQEDQDALPPATRERRELAQRVFHLGYLHQAAGDLENALDLYQRSIAVLPTAEGHTFVGWCRAHDGRLEEAMAECHKAIAVDPALGNPYNDIGAYLLQLGRPDEAVPWLERALRAKRYEAPFFPHLNLARVRHAQGDLRAARDHLEKVLELNPGYAPALELLRQLEGAGR